MKIKNLAESMLFSQDTVKVPVREEEEVLNNEETKEVEFVPTFNDGDLVVSASTFGRVIRSFEVFGQERIEIETLGGINAVVPVPGMQKIEKEDVLKFLGD